jgi:2-hydroxycyclohexanecarboxyl-CoA dehydrogenase
MIQRTRQSSLLGQERRVAETDSESRVALVTGSGRGIGAAIADALAADGTAIAIVDLDGDNAEQHATTLRARGVRALGLQADISDAARMRHVVGEASNELGPIDVLVNNAGWDKIEPFVDNTEEDWDKILTINLKGPIIVTRAVLDQMIERKSGSIVNIASDAGRVGSSGEAVYSAAKGGVIAFTKTLAREMARYGIRVNCVCPGPTETALLGTLDDKLRASIERAIPMRRVAQPDDIAPAVVFLAGAGARYITGQTLSVSGGLTMT